MLLDPVTWMPASRSEEVLAALAPRDRRAHRGRDARLGRRAGDRPARDGRRRRGRAARGPARRASPPGSARSGWPPPWPARTRWRAGRTPRSRRAPATSSCTRRCASSRGASRRSRCTCTSRCPTRTPPCARSTACASSCRCCWRCRPTRRSGRAATAGSPSARIPVFQAFPRTGTPRAFDVLRGLRRGGRRAAPLRRDPRADVPVVGRAAAAAARAPIEVRIMDAQTRVRDTAALAALVQCLVRREALERADGPRAASRPRCSRRTASSPRATACDAKFVDPGAGLLRPGRRPAAPRRCARARRTRSGCAASAELASVGALAAAPGRAAPARGRRARRGPARRAARAARRTS